MIYLSFLRNLPQFNMVKLSLRTKPKCHCDCLTVALFFYNLHFYLLGKNYEKKLTLKVSYISTYKSYFCNHFSVSINN